MNVLYDRCDYDAGWKAGYKGGPDLPPPDINDSLAWSSGYIEGKTLGNSHLVCPDCHSVNSHKDWVKYQCPHCEQVMAVCHHCAAVVPLSIAARQKDRELNRLLDMI